MRRKPLIIFLTVVALLILVLLYFRDHKQETAADGKAVETVSVSAITTIVDCPKYKAQEDEDGNFTVTVDDDTVYPLSDVTEDTAFHDAIAFAVASGVMNTDNHQFQPDYGVTRSRFAVVLYRFLCGEGEDVPQTEFADIKKAASYYEAACWANANDLLTADEEGAFHPNDFVTCETALTILYRVAGRPKAEEDLPKDYPYAAKVSDYAKSAISWAIGRKLINVKEDIWYPTQVVSRAQLAALLQKYSDLF